MTERWRRAQSRRRTIRHHITADCTLGLQRPSHLVLQANCSRVLDRLCCNSSGAPNMSIAPLTVSQMHAMRRCQNPRIQAGKIVRQLQTAANTSNVESFAPRNTNGTVIRGTVSHSIPGANRTRGQNCRKRDRSSIVAICSLQVVASER